MEYIGIDKEGTANNIKNMIKRRGLTYKVVQEELGLGSVQAVYGWTRRNNNLPTVDNLVCLARLFDCSMDDMIATTTYGGGVIENDR